MQSAKDQMAAFTARTEMKRIVIEVGEEDGPKHRRAFEGFWLVTGSRPADDQVCRWPANAEWSVALSKGARLMVYVTFRDKRGGELTLYDGFDELRESDEVPETLVAEVAAGLGIDYVIEMNM